ncbi:DNA methyltransferase [Desulfobacca acetoxidans]|uniref:DNA methylase N-4/N-6 domain protein n=1 Tax=Desulfobacca acetoxidans (strain ATCC 700848 / DSM 11109 / ASRB2) TaxID=880072 RepID=F2NI42_DESAR|nr:DNA methyltransferase [Desulfobacca acetoxidans]AEB09668.1 DNA methylase N-4/N-6 domain protein [Desulfobacca acetoxidans DSM 11109]
MNAWQNQLYFGDNLNILREYLPSESVDLIYLDPPFNSKATYNVLFAEKSGDASVAQITAFDDTWHWGREAEEAFHDLITTGPVKLSHLIAAFRSFLGQNDMMAYIVMMAIRLVELHRVLKPTGSIYLHCDPTASHYIKLLLDSIFEVKNFRNEIIWKRSQPKAHAVTRFSRSHDTIFFYAKSEKTKFAQQYSRYKEDYVKKFYRHIEPETGRIFQLGDLTNPNRNRPNLTYEFPPGSGITRVWRWTQEKMMKAWKDGMIVIPEQGGVPRLKRYFNELKGTLLTDIWVDIEHLHGSNKEWLKYPTQKPEALLYRIIKTSSNEGDVVLDPFCGCGTATVVAERLKRRWIGIDITHLAITLIKKRLRDTFGESLSDFRVIGAPTDWTSAAALAEHNRHQFEWWALSLVDARPAQDKRKGPDTGVDGYIYFFDDNTEKPKKIVVQVKSGAVSVAQVRDLKGVLEREKAALGAFLTLKEPSRQMLAEAAAAGYYEPEQLNGLKFPRLQVLTIADLLAGKQLEHPKFGAATFKSAPKQRKGPVPEDTQKNLL